MEVTLGWCRPLLAPVLLATALTALAGDGPDRTILIHTEAGIRVDATGHVEAVELDPQLPAALREHLGKLIRDWTFAPVMRDDRDVGGKTYADGPVPGALR